MSNLNTLEARVAAATQSLAGRHGQARELHSKFLELEDELTRSRTDSGRLQSELSKCHDEKSKLEERLEQVAGENRRLINEAVRNREEISRLEAEEAERREERDRLATLLDSLMQAIERQSGDDQDGSHHEAASRSSHSGAIDLPSASADGNSGHPGWLALGSAKPQPGQNGSDNDVPNEAARRLMDRIRDRIEAHQRA